MAKLKDVAEKAGVSLTTASRVLSMHDNISVSKETEERIRAVAKELKYQPGKRGAAKPAKNQAASIGYVLQVAKEQFEDTFFSKIIHGIEQEIIGQRLNLAFAYSVYDLQDPVILENVLNSDVNGVIFIGNIPGELYNLLIDKFPHCVAALTVPEERPIDCITLDYENSMFKLVRNLIKSGHRRIAYIGGGSYGLSPETIGDGNFYLHDERFQGYLKALFDQGVEVDRSLIKDGNWDMETGYNKMSEILESGTELTAVVAASDRMAIGAMRAIQERSLRIPDDIAITGYDDIETSRFVHPPLTTINYPKEDIGRMSVQLLMNKIVKKEISFAQKIVLPCQIIERESHTAINARSHAQL